ncbi:MAG TPA: sarcosine oxidase subunit gamma family protein [Steroidobacteraceae bacterium]|jgi:sarcosine oxidase subunit gamma|nr:sarcosine oxidase subunit gamma family protein [Steroidobacteraceae bacterium]
MLEECFSVLPRGSRFIFHGDAKARAAASTAWGVAFAEQACRAIVAGERATLWLGPDEYLLLESSGVANLAAASAAATAGAANAIEQALGELPHALVDISHRQIAMQLRGPHAAEILNGACPLDLGIEEFPVGACTRTVFAKAEIVLWRTAPDTFQLEVWRSFAAYVTGLVREIAVEIYGAG